MRILFNNYLGNKTSAQGIMIKETVESLRKFHEVRIAQNGKLVESNIFRPISRTKFRSVIGRYLNEPRRLLANVKRIYLETNILKEFAPDVVINIADYLAFSMALLTKIMRIPHIIFMDGPVVYETRRVDLDHIHFPFIPEFIERRVLESSQAVITVSANLKKYFLNKYLIPPEKVHVIPNGVDINRFKPSVNSCEVSAKYDLQNKIVVGFAGAFKNWHSISELIDIMDFVVNHYNNVCFLLVGDGPKKKDIENSFSNRYKNKIAFTGYVAPQEMPMYISAMDITLAPYSLQGDFFYGSPMKILEYMACGKPVVANKFGPIEPVIKDGHNGFLVEPGDNKVFVQRLNELIADGKLREVMGRRARKTVVANYTWEHRAAAIAEVCDQVYANYDFKRA